jgi:peptidoglycan/LPS O-acetylase OafA/YrhL
MRAIAACSILLYHSTQVFVTGGVAAFGVLAVAARPLWLGVTAFFVISGFLLYRPFAAAMVNESEFPSVRRYFRHRILRIVPAYWAILAFTGFILGTAFINPVTSQTGSLANHLHLFVLDAFLAQEYAPSTIGTGILPAWSLTAEAVFYVLLPVLALAAFRAIPRAAGPRARLAIALVPVAVLEAAGLVGHILDTYVVPGPIGSFAMGWHSVIDRGFLGQADGFAWGMLVAVIWCEVKAGRLTVPARRSRLILEAAAVLGGLVMLKVAPPMATLVLPVPFALLLGYIALNQNPGSQPVLIRILGSKPLVAVGLASYSVFLWNFPILGTMGRHGLVFGGYAGYPLTLAVLATLTGVCSYVTYRYIEVPAIRIARRRSVKPMAAQAPAIDAPVAATIG